MVNKKKKKFRVESNWRDYYGSNAELLEDIKSLGKGAFKREITHLCKSKAACSYLELKEQIITGALEHEAYYNQWISCKIRKSQLLL